MPGDIQKKYGTWVDLSSSGTMASLAAEQTWLSGWATAPINSASYTALDFLIAQEYTTSSLNRQIGEIRNYVYTRTGASTWPNILSSGNFPNGGAITLTSKEARDNGMIRASYISANATASAIFALPVFSLCNAGGWTLPPEYWGMYITHNVSTSTNAGFSSGAQTLNMLPVFAQYT